jgi:CRP-like cAMP-binding protein
LINQGFNRAPVLAHMSDSRHSSFFLYVVHMTDKPATTVNGLLSRLLAKELRELNSRAEKVPLPVSYDCTSPASRSNMYFITNGVASTVKDLDDDSTIEIATVGPESMVGINLLLGSDRTDHRAFIQIAGEGLRVKASMLKRILPQCPRLKDLLLRYALALLNQIAQSAACNRIHTVDERCARWLLMSHDRVKSDSFALTQEFLAQMLGVHRPTVSVAAGMLQKAGFIQYVRGIITIKDRKGLESAACGCYRSIIKEYERLVTDERRLNSAALPRSDFNVPIAHGGVALCRVLHFTEKTLVCASQSCT